MRVRVVGRIVRLRGLFGSRLLVILVGIQLAGCAVTHSEIEAAGTFGKSAAALAEGVKTAYAQAPQDESDIRAGKFIIRDQGNRYYPRAGSLGITALQGRLAAAAVLSAYGQTLGSLLDAKSQKDSISQATDKLTAALKRLPASVRTRASITDAEIVSAGKLVIAVSEIYVDYLRLEALRETVPVLEPVITKLCLMFGNDFDPDKPGFAQVYHNAADKILDYSNTLRGDAANQERAAVLPTFQRLDAIRTKTEITFRPVRQAAASCAKSSLALRRAVEAHEISYDDLADFANKAAAAYEAVTAFRSNK